MVESRDGLDGKPAQNTPFPLPPTPDEEDALKRQQVTLAPRLHNPIYWRPICDGWVLELGCSWTMK